MTKKINFYILTASLIILTSCTSFNVIDKPISFSETRIDLTKQYIQDHYNISVENIEIDPKIIVLHWTAVDDFEECFDIFNRETLENSRPDLMTESNSQVNVSIQFLVARDGEIYRLMPETWMARHVIGLNFNAIGFENVGGGNNIDNLTNDQVEANIELIKYLKNKYPSIEYLIGHHEYREFEGHKLWLEINDEYRTVKYDPGDRFMQLVREGVKELNLKGIDEIRSEIKSKISYK